MKILLLSYGIIDFEGRLREQIKIFKSIGDTTYVTRVHEIGHEKDHRHCPITDSGYLGMLRFCIKTAALTIKNKRFDILFVNDRKSLIPSLFIYFFKKPKIIIQDVSELYLFKEVKGISGKFGCILEYFFFKRSNLLICANKYRARIMKKIFSLRETPLVFENIRCLEHNDQELQSGINQNEAQPEDNKKIRVISTSGCSLSRLTDSLVLAFKELEEKYELYLVGCLDGTDRKAIETLIKVNCLSNVHLLGKLDQNDLKRMIRKCHIGIVNYNSRDVNNRYCASGKIYEFLFEGLPVVTTENLPLVHLVNKNKIGIADNSFYRGIEKVACNYSYFSENVFAFSSTISVLENNQKLREDIMNAIKKSSHRENEGSYEKISSEEINDDN